MSVLEGFHTINREVYGGRKENPFGRAQSIALPLERFSAGREAHNLVWKPRETSGVNNYQQTSFGMREASDGVARVVGVGLEVVGTSIHGPIRILATINSEIEKAKKQYLPAVLGVINEWQSPWGRNAAHVVSWFAAPLALGAAIVQGIVWGGLKGIYGLLKDKAESLVTHSGGPGQTYFQRAAEAYRGN
ncbi:MAG: hypothetical protein WC880_02275 [Candidatus Paceibacterota bacterium]